MADAANPHVVLVGLSGTGKTSIGKLLAQRLSMPFVDTDDGVEARAARTVREVFEHDGEAAFRALEASVVTDVLSAREPTVVATGGGAVVTSETRERLQGPDVFCVWLTAQPGFLASRAGGKRHRPLLDDDPVKVLTRLSEQRQPWFEQVADAVLNVQPALGEEPKPVAKARLAGCLADMVELRRDRRSRDHVVFVGPMGVGKSTVGRIVATRLRRTYVDSDGEVERRTGRSARAVADADGLPALHQLELTVLRDALTAANPSVIGAAASVVDESIGRLALGTARQVVWLRADPGALQRRVRDDHHDSHRPEIDPSTVAWRDSCYAAVATTIVDVDELAPDVVADKVLA